jgi:hypothetical protein
MKRIDHVRIYIIVLICLNAKFIFAQTFIPDSVSDQTATAPLSNPTPGSFQPRYISGFGTDNSFTVFFEDRDNSNKISYNSTTTGINGFSASSTETNITDTHFCVKDWSITIEETEYNYRGWGAVGNNPDHHFYVSDDLTNWTCIDTFTIPNAAEFTSARGSVYYGFHDVIQINGTYYAFAEANSGETMIVRSSNGDNVWEAFDKVGGTQASDGNLEVRTGVTNGWTPSGNFVNLGYNRGYGKIHVDPEDNYFYLTINRHAKPNLPAADLETAFIDPSNWKWHDGTTGPASNAILSATVEHDLRECWVVPNTDQDSSWIIIYDADFGAGDGGKALGYAVLGPPAQNIFAEVKIWLEGPYQAGGSMTTSLNGEPSDIPLSSPYSGAPRTVTEIPSGISDWIMVELRTTSDGSAVDKQSFFLKSDGNIVDTDGSTTDLSFSEHDDGDYFIVLHHRNHCAVMSVDSIAASDWEYSLYNFTSGSGQFFGTGGTKEVETNVWGMWGGDINQDAQVTTMDYTAWYNSSRIGETGYKDTDVNMDTQVTTMDYVIWYNNAKAGATSTVP